MYIGIRKPMLKYYLEQILGYQKEILTESQGAADKLQQGHETPHFSSSSSMWMLDPQSNILQLICHYLEEGRQFRADSGKSPINMFTTGGLGQPAPEWLQQSLLQWIRAVFSASPAGLLWGLEEAASTLTQWKAGYRVYQRDFLLPPFPL